MNAQWQQRNRPARLEKRYTFENYEALRVFLERAAELSEREGYYPDLGFGRNYVNITIHAEDRESDIPGERHAFAGKLDELLGDASH